jgi:ribonucleoside-diphosphate reductase beta chain
MATTLLELTQQGDPGTLGTEEQARKIKLLNPQELYGLWERQNWISQEIDFGRDLEDWRNLNDEEREWAVWSLSSFFIGEERVTTQFSGLVMAYEDEQEEAFLTTQQVDEARHMQFFDRFYREVIGLEEPDIEGRLARVREDLNDAFVELFDRALVEAGQRLIQDPSDTDAKVDFITTYHMVIEGTLALTGQHFITKYWEDNDLMPGFVEGFNRVARDEHRHVAYGTWYLKRACGEDERLADRMRAKLAELLPVANGVLVPKGQDPNEEWEMLGYTSAEIHEFAFNALTRRLKAIGVPLSAEPVAA